MKKIRYHIIYITILTLLLIPVGNGFAQSNARDKQAIRITREFYTAYITIWATRMKGLVKKRKLDSLLTIYCTPKLRKFVSGQLLDHDFFLQDMLTDVKHLSTLSVVKDPDKQNVYNVSYISLTTTNAGEPIEKKNNMHVTFVTENRALKFDTVYGD